ncbi:MAG: UDP-N-acetylmuramyl-tripeptide synthetase [Actinomycetaceae bacterium]|nr:UDP-N-acetylmuramyl-tripeptide synthetase [Actinomycetaceae bacterium]
MDSRKVDKDSVFFAVPGATFHGANFTVDVLRRGSRIVITDTDGLEIIRKLSPADIASAVGDDIDSLVVAVITVDDVRYRIGTLSAWIYDDPSADVEIVGVTGTNGKTTTTMMIRNALVHLGRNCGLVGTIHTVIGGETAVSQYTTVEAPEMQSIADRWRQNEDEFAAIEVSSHGVAAHRILGTRLSVLGFLNLQHDHLDFHRTMEAYYQAKAEPFLSGQAQRGVICVNDAWGRRLAAESSIPILTYAMFQRYDGQTVGNERPDGVDYWVSDITYNERLGREEFTIYGPEGNQLRSSCPIPGEHNIENQMMAILCLRQLGFNLKEAADATSTTIAVPGRLERILIDGLPDDAPEVYVDYAHTAEAIDVTLATLRERCRGKLVCIVGANGDRDVEKRPHMGYAAAKWADIIHVCDDTPYNDDPLEVRKAISRGINLAVNDGYQLYYDVQSIRETAMWEMIRDAHTDDIIVFLGRGHEDLQVIHGYDHFLLDAHAARRMLQRRYEIEPETGRLYDDPLYAAIIDDDPRLCDQRLLMTISRAVNATGARLIYVSPRGNDLTGFFTLPAFALLFGATNDIENVTASTIFVADDSQHDKIAQALRRGATAVIATDEDSARQQVTSLGKSLQQRAVPVLLVNDAKKALRDLAGTHLDDIRDYEEKRGRTLTTVVLKDSATYPSKRDAIIDLLSRHGETVVAADMADPKAQGAWLTALHAGTHTRFLVIDLDQDDDARWLHLEQGKYSGVVLELQEQLDCAIQKVSAFFRE